MSDVPVKITALIYHTTHTFECTLDYGGHVQLNSHWMKHLALHTKYAYVLNFGKNLFSLLEYF